MVNLEQRISQWLEHWQIGTAPKEKTGQKTGIVVGLSGGADSVSLLLLLQSAAQERGLELTAVHVHHGIRGAEADRDAAFAKQLCEQYGISFHCEHVDIPALAAAQGWTLEEAGRKERYRIFEEIRQEAGASWIAVAHQKQDQAETMLFHLVRGSSLRGMGGIRPVSGRIIRPLLDTDRTELEQWLRNKGISWCEDSTNREPDASRNVLRLSIIPQLRQLQPDLEGVLSQEAALFAEAADYLSSQAEAEFRAQQTGQQSEAATAEPAGQKSVISLSVSRLQELHPALRREVLYRALWEAAGAKKDLTAHHVELLLRLCSLQSGRRLMLPYEVEVEREYDRLYFKRQTSEEENRDRCERKIRADIRILDGAEARKIAENDCTKCFDYANIEEIPMFRHKRPGDRIILYADGRGKKLQDLLTDRKIPARKRDQLLVLASGSEVLWIPGIRRSAGHRVGEQTEQAVVVRMSEEEKEKIGGTMAMKESIRVLLSEEEIEKRVTELGRQISADYAGKSVHLICILKGGVMFTCELAKRLSVPVSMDFMSVSSYGGDTKSSGVVRIVKDLDEPLEGKDVLIVEDIIDSGRTLSYLIEILGKRNPASIRLCTLLDKPERRVKKQVKVDYSGFVIPDEFVVGYGLDYDQRYRNLPYIGVVEFSEEEETVE